jgi:hypothetical protein
MRFFKSHITKTWGRTKKKNEEEEEEEEEKKKKRKKRKKKKKKKTSIIFCRNKSHKGTLDIKSTFVGILFAKKSQRFPSLSFF